MANLKKRKNKKQTKNNNIKKKIKQIIKNKKKKKKKHFKGEKNCKKCNSMQLNYTHIQYMPIGKLKVRHTPV